MYQLINRLTLASLKRPWHFVLAACGLTAISIVLTVVLFNNVRSSIAELLPSNLPAVRNLNDLVRRVGGDGTILIALAVPDEKDLPGAEALAPKLVKDIEGLGPKEIRSVEWNETEMINYFESRWPMIMSLDELKEKQADLKREIRKVLEKQMIDLGDDEPAKGSALTDPNEPMPREIVQKRLGLAQFDHGFLVHPDKKSLTLLLRPAGTSLGVGDAQALIQKLRDLIGQHQAELDAGHMKVLFGGSFPVMVEELKAIMNGVAMTALICMALVLLSLFLFFRDGRSTVVLGTTVVMAVLLTFGITELVIGYLNTQTAFLGSIVVGNGINYGLIYLARVQQLRKSGATLETAVVAGAHTAASATLLASAASSVSFAVLMFASNRGFRHFGFIGGMGMLLCWVFTFTLVPAFLQLWERWRPLSAAPDGLPELKQAPRWLVRLFASPGALIGIFGVLLVMSTVLFVRQLPTAIERNLDNLGNDLKGQEQLHQDNDRANGGTGRSSAGAIALMDSREDADAFCDVVRQRKADKTHPLNDLVIEKCETISAVIPNHQAEKLAIINDIHNRLTEKLLNAVSPEQAKRLREIKADLELQKPVADSEAPASLLDRFRERDGSIGRLALVTARGDAHIEQAERLQAFVDAVRNVPVGGKTYDATGENVILADLLKDIEVEGPATTLGSLLGVCILVLFFMRRWRTRGEVIGALIAGVILMGGVGAALHLRINFFNFIVFPITFGIAVDYGANVVVRIRERGGDVLSALYEVGPAVALCSWTSMIGYGSLIIAVNRALQSFGWYALVGEITSILAALVLLPAMALVAIHRRERAPETAPTSG